MSRSQAGPPRSTPTQRYQILTGSMLPSMLKFGLPLSIGMGLHALFNVVDMVVVGNLPDSSQALSVVALCDLLAMLATIVANGVGSAAVAVIARMIGEGNSRRATQVCWRGLTLLVVFSGLFAVLALSAAQPIVAATGAKGWVRETAVDYLQVIMGGAITAFLLVYTTSVLRAVGHSYTPTLLLFGANLLNFVLSVLLVYGPHDAPELLSWGPVLADWLGIPHIGVLGAAWGTVIARAVVGIPALLLMARDLRPRSRSDFYPTQHDTRQLISIAWPSSSQYLVRVVAILVLLGVVAHQFTTAADSSALGALGVCIRLDTVGLFMALGWGSAAATFVGQNLGAGRLRRAAQAGWLAAALNSALLLLIGGAYMLFARPLAALFSDAQGVIDVCVLYLMVVGPSYVAIGFAAALTTALAGAGETLVSLKIDSLVLFGFQIPMLLVLVVGFSLPLVTCFVLVSLSNFAGAVLYGYAFARGRWSARRLS